MKPMKLYKSHWNRKFWAIQFTGKDTTFVLGTGWCPDRRGKTTHPDEPSRVLLFLTRAKARQWCIDARERYRLNCPEWRFRVVRVSEIIKVIYK